MGIIRKRIVVLLAVLALMTASFASCGSVAGVEEEGETLSVIFQGKIDDGGANMDIYYFLIQNTSDEPIMSAQVDIAGIDEDGETMELLERWNYMTPKNGGIGYPIPHLNPGEVTILSVGSELWGAEPASYDIEFEQIKRGDDIAPSLTVVDEVYNADTTIDVTLKNECDEECSLVYDSADEDILYKKNERIPNLIAVQRDGDGNVISLYFGSPEEEKTYVFAPDEEKTINFTFTNGQPDFECMVEY